MKTSSIILVIICFVSCYGGYVPNKERDKYKDTNNCKLTFKGIKEFVIDDETSYVIPYLQFVDNGEKRYLTFFNRYNHSIYFYDYDSSQFVKKIRYEKEGPNGVGDMQGYCYVNDDSIFVHSYWGRRLMHTNSNGEVLSRMEIKDKGSYDTIYPAIFVMTPTPMKKYGNKIIMTGFVIGEMYDNATKRITCVIYDMESNTTQYVIDYPEQYKKYNWGGGVVYWEPYFDTNGENIIISFSADHYLSVYSIETGELKKPYAGSSEIKGIRSFPYPKEPNIDENRMWEWFICNDFYKSVFYDKYKNVYYRMAQLPVDEYVQGYNGNEKPTIIVVLDSDMNYLGEALLPKAKFEYEMHSCFVSPDGFNIQVNTDNDDMLTFYTYTFLPDEKDEK